jgi:hypothetical protein
VPRLARAIALHGWHFPSVGVATPSEPPRDIAARAKVSFGSRTTVFAVSCHVRFTPDNGGRSAAGKRREVPILLQKSKVATTQIFRENAKQETIADSYIFNRVAEVACEFDARGRVPSRLYTKVAPTARRIFDDQRKTTFATQSAIRVVSALAAPPLGRRPLRYADGP